MKATVCQNCGAVYDTQGNFHSRASAISTLTRLGIKVIICEDCKKKADCL